jgi:hypothetical protein
MSIHLARLALAGTLDPDIGRTKTLSPGGKRTSQAACQRCLSLTATGETRHETDFSGLLWVRPLDAWLRRREERRSGRRGDGRGIASMLLDNLTGVGYGRSVRNDDR